jgi:hypothetical protein
LELDMPHKNREIDFHLTPVGWTRNAISAAYTIETWRLSIYQESGWSKEQRAWRRTWHNMAWSETERERFRLTFPMPAEVQVNPPSVAPQSENTDVERKRA